jgi:hypothetical protein
MRFRHSSRSNIGIGAGSLAFQGSVAEEVAFFASLGSPLPPFANPAEHALSCLDVDHGPLGLPTLWRLRRLHLLYQTLPAVKGASAAALIEQLHRLLRLADHHADVAADLPGDLAALAHAIDFGGGSFTAFVSAMLACLLAAEPRVDAIGGEHSGGGELPSAPARTSSGAFSGAAMADALEALGMPLASAAPATVARLNDVAARMERCAWFTALHREYAAAVARRMDIHGPHADTAAAVATSDADGMPSEEAQPQSAAQKASARAAEQAQRLTRAYNTGGWTWSLPSADAADVLCALGYDRVMSLSPRQVAALTEALAVDGDVAFGELATTLYLHAYPSLPPGAADADAPSSFAPETLLAAAAPGAASMEPEATRRFLRAVFPLGARLDGRELTDAQADAYARFLDADADGAVTAPDVARWLRASAALRDTLCASAAPALVTTGDAVAAESRPDYANNGFTQWRLLLRREFQMLSHDRQQVATICGMTILIPLFLGGMYWRIEHTQGNFTNLVAALFLSCLFAGILPLNTTMMTFPTEQVIVKREYGNGCYNSLSYYASKASFLSLARGGQSVVVAQIIYFMAGIYPTPLTFGNVVVFFFALVIVVIWSSCAGLMFGAARAAVRSCAMRMALTRIPAAVRRHRGAGRHQRGSGVHALCARSNPFLGVLSHARQHPTLVYLVLLHQLLPLRAGHRGEESFPHAALPPLRRALLPLRPRRLRRGRGAPVRRRRRLHGDAVRRLHRLRRAHHRHRLPGARAAAAREAAAQGAARGRERARPRRRGHRGARAGPAAVRAGVRHARRRPAGRRRGGRATRGAGGAAAALPVPPAARAGGVNFPLDCRAQDCVCRWCGHTLRLFKHLSSTFVMRQATQQLGSTFVARPRLAHSLPYKCARAVDRGCGDASSRGVARTRTRCALRA